MMFLVAGGNTDAKMQSQDVAHLFYLQIADLCVR